MHARIGRDYNDTLSWCMAGCPYQGHEGGNSLCDEGSVDCEEVVDSAQRDAHDWLKDCFRIMGAGCLVNAVVLIAGISCAVRYGEGIEEGIGCEKSRFVVLAG